MSTIKVKPANGEDDNSYGEYYYEILRYFVPFGGVRFKVRMKSTDSAWWGNQEDSLVVGDQTI